MTTEEFMKSFERKDEECKTAKALSDEERKKIYDFIFDCTTGYFGSDEGRKEWTEKWCRLCLRDDDATADMLRLADTCKDEFKNPVTVKDIITYAGY